MSASSTEGKGSPSDRDLRLRERYFPDAESVIFKTSGKAYGPLPILTRKLLKHITAPALRVYVYLLTRSGKHRICFPTMEEMADELGVSRKNLTAPVKRLEKVKMISTHSAGGRRYYLLHDPRIPLQHLVDEGTIAGDELLILNDLAADLGQSTFVAGGSKPPKP